jgi:hypothetical protein
LNVCFGRSNPDFGSDRLHDPIIWETPSLNPLFAHPDHLHSFIHSFILSFFLSFFLSSCIHWLLQTFGSDRLHDPIIRETPSLNPLFAHPDHLQSFIHSFFLSFILHPSPEPPSKLSDLSISWQNECLLR